MRRRAIAVLLKNLNCSKIKRIFRCLKKAGKGSTNLLLQGFYFFFVCVINLYKKFFTVDFYAGAGKISDLFKKGSSYFVTNSDLYLF